MSAAETQAARYRALAQALVDAEGLEHGARARAARRLGVSPSYFTRLLSGERAVGEQAIDRAVERLGLLRSYFTAEELEHDDPLRYVGRRNRSKGAAPDVGAAVAALLALDPATRRKVIAFVEDLDVDGASG